MADDREHNAAHDQDEQERTNVQPGAGQGQSGSPFLRKIRQVERQGVPEEGAVNPGPPPRPVRSGDFHAAPTPPEQSHGEER